MKNHHFLAVDVGNTSVTMGLFYGRTLVRKDTVLTHSFTAADLKSKAVFKHAARAALIASVVPGKVPGLKRLLRQVTGAPVGVIGEDVKVPIANRASRPNEVGIDRLVNAFQAWRLYRRPSVVVDFGTAITFDIVSKKGEYAGGIIAPGVELTLNALYEKTALLPKVRLQRPRSIIGKNTEECIRSGTSYGLGALCDGILTRLFKETRTRHKIIATGGYARYMAAYTRLIRDIDEDFTLKGIQGIHEAI